MTANRVFRVDEDFDREHAPSGGSRFGAEVLWRVAEFADAWGDIAPVTFAVTAWRIAADLNPGYVRWHRRVITASCRRSPWDGGLIGAVTLVSPWPAELTNNGGGRQDRGWRGWPRLFGQYVAPSEQDLTRSPHMRATLLVEAPVRLDDLPTPPDGPDDRLVELAHRAVTVLTRELNDLL